MRAYLNILVVLVLASALAVSCGKSKKQDKGPDTDNPKTAADYLHRATKNFLNSSEAIKDATKAIELDPKYAPAYEFRAERYMKLYGKTKKQDDAHKAIADYDRLLELKPTRDKAAGYYRKRGVLKVGIDDADGAIADFRASAKAGGNESRAYEYLAQAYLAKGDRDKAIECLSAAIRTDDRNTVYYKARAEIYRAIKEYDKALADLMTVDGIQPDAANYVAIAQLYEEMGDPTEAITWYEKYRKATGAN